MGNGLNPTFQKFCACIPIDLNDDLCQICVKLSSTICVKVSSKLVHSTRSYCIIKVPYQNRQKRGEVTCRPKIDHLNYGKRPIKHTRGQSPLSEESNELLIESKITNFEGVTCTNTKCTGHELDKMEVCVLANFSKTAERNKTLFTGIQVRLKLSSNQ